MEEKKKNLLMEFVPPQLKTYPKKKKNIVNFLTQSETAFKKTPERSHFTSTKKKKRVEKGSRSIRNKNTSLPFLSTISFQSENPKSLNISIPTLKP